MYDTTNPSYYICVYLEIHSRRRTSEGGAFSVRGGRTATADGRPSDGPVRDRALGAELARASADP